MKYNDNMKQYQRALKSKFNEGFQDGRQGEFNLGLITGSLKRAYLLGFNRGSAVRVKTK